MGTYADDPVKRGEYLVQIGSCNDCHTPWVFDEELQMPVNDFTRLLSGHPSDAPDPVGELAQGDMAIIGPTFTSFKLPFGVIYAANLTPDPESGTGSWTEDMFIDVFRKGRHLGGDGRGVLPPMPWNWVRNLSDEDLKAIWAYLQTVPPVYNVVPSPKVPDEALGPIRDSMDKWVATLPQQEWATRTSDQVKAMAQPRREAAPQ